MDHFLTVVDIFCQICRSTGCLKDYRHLKYESDAFPDNYEIIMGEGKFTRKLVTKDFTEAV